MSEGLIAAGRRAPASPVPPLDNDDLLGEILLRLPPHHASLPRAALVCRRWRRLVSDPAFLRRFRARAPPPLLGFFIDDYGDPVFTSTTPPGRRAVPSVRFALPPRPGEQWSLLGCRHGLALLLDRTRQEAVVWDPVTGLQRRVPYPPGFRAGVGEEGLVCNGAVACAAAGVHGGDCHLRHFRLVLVRVKNSGDLTRAFACLYESKSETWGSITSTAITHTSHSVTPGPSVMVGNALCWLLFPGRTTILEFDMDRQSLAVIPQPDTHLPGHTMLCRQNSSELGLVILSKLVIQLWSRKVNSDGHGTVEWALQKTVELEKLLSLRPAIERWRPTLLGYDEDNNQLFIMTAIGVFMIQLESLQFRNLFESSFITFYFPYTSFYTADRKIGNDHERGEMSNDCAVRSTKVCVQQA